jgi:hypothetical protein
MIFGGTRLDAFAHQGDVLVDEPVDCTDAGQPLLVVPGRLEHDDVGQAVQRGKSALLRQRRVLRAVVVGVDARLVLAAEQVAVQLVCGGQCLRVDPVERRDDRLVAVVGSLQAFRGEVRPAVVVAMVANIGGGDRVFAQQALPLGVEQRVQPFGSTRFVRRLGRCGQGQGQQQEQGGQDRSHAINSIYKRTRCSGPGGALASHHGRSAVPASFAQSQLLHIYQ